MLRWMPKTRGDCADRLSARLVSDLVAWEGEASKRTNVRRKGLGKLKVAVAAFAADLLHARNHPEADGWVYRPLAKGSFTGKAVSSRDFRSIGDAWIACGLLEHEPGYIKTVESIPAILTRTRGKVSRFRATPTLVQTCAEYGVTPKSAGEHFRYPPPDIPGPHSRFAARWFLEGGGADIEVQPDKATCGPRTTRERTERLPRSTRHPWGNSQMAQAHLPRGRSARIRLE